MISAKPQCSEEHGLRNTVIDDLRMNFEICLNIRSVVEHAILYYSTTLRAIVKNCMLYAPKPAVGVIKFTYFVHGHVFINNYSLL